MNTLIHPIGCPVWETGSVVDCTCPLLAAWRIRKDPFEQFPWRIWRLTGDATYESMMGCSSFEGARQLVLQLMWLRTHAIKREADV